MASGAHIPHFANPPSGSPGSVAASSASSPSPSRSGMLHSFFLAGPAGRLEALLNEGAAEAPYASLVCHPHPSGGGTMHNKVVYHAAKVFSARGWPVLRFNFRGTGLSEGAHHGKEEAEDVTAALAWLSERYSLPIVAAGFSFGAAMGLRASCGNPAVRAFAALGLPTHAEGRDYHYAFLTRCAFPKLLLSGDRDQYAPADQLRALAGSAAPPTQLNLIPRADHFFTGHIQAMQTALGQWLQDTFLATLPQAPTTEVTP